LRPQLCSPLSASGCCVRSYRNNFAAKVAFGQSSDVHTAVVLRQWSRGRACRPTEWRSSKIRAFAQRLPELRVNTMQIEIGSDDILIDAALLADLLRLDPTAVHSLMRTREITSFCERGIGENEGEYRLSFFYGNRRARLNIDSTGNVIRRSMIDFGQAVLPRQLHRTGG
jgi:hypothetical protein